MFNVKKIIIITIGLLLIASAFSIPYFIAKKPKPIVPVKPIEVKPEQRPVVINETLYSKIREVPINQIVRISIYQEPVRFVIVEWKENNKHGGMFTMSFEDFMKVYPVLSQVKGIKYA